MCRSRRELSNAYLLAKFGFDTAENEPCKVCPIERSSSSLGRSGRGGLVVHGLEERAVGEHDRAAGVGAVPGPFLWGTYDSARNGVIFQATYLQHW